MLFLNHPYLAYPYQVTPCLLTPLILTWIENTSGWRVTSFPTTHPYLE